MADLSGGPSWAEGRFARKHPLPQLAYQALLLSRLLLSKSLRTDAMVSIPLAVSNANSLVEEKSVQRSLWYHDSING